MIRSLQLITCIFFCALTTVFSQDYSALEYRNVGPYRGGRVTAVAGIVTEPGTFYFGATGGGVWKTTDYGTSWNNISDGFFKTPSIGAISVAQNDGNIVYVGTGTDGLRSNTIEGKGMYKSIDGGATWEEIGLAKAGQIGAVRIHPQDHNTVYVAAIGNAFKSNSERGIYKTTDGGNSWKKILFVSDKTGFSDIEMMPSNPNILYASAWKAERKPWTIISGGTMAEGGIYKSIDGGESWKPVKNGLPKDLIGKIDLEICAADSSIVYALVEAPGKEGGLYKSTDQGESFKQISSHNGIRTRPFYYTNLKANPKDPNMLYAMATGYYKSVDGGKNWDRLSPPHGDNHDMWINPNNPDLFIQSNDGGANVTHTGGKTWSTQYNQPTAEIYQVAVDNQYPYWLYGGMQDNYTTVAVPSMAPFGVQLSGLGYIQNTGGCETGPAIPHPTNPDIVYSNCKGKFTVYNKKTGTEKSYFVGAAFMYGHNPKDLKYRFQRVSPIHVSPHNASVIYHTSQYVHKTTNEGVTWETISPDLTAFEKDKQVISGSPITRDITGEEFYSTIYAIRESPLVEGLLWVGANDGPVHVSRDGGKTWVDVTPKGLPAGGRVDAVEPSPHNPAKAYISVLRYQLGDTKPYIYKTENYGKSWTLLTPGTNGIPKDYPTRVVREDPEKEGLLFAGTEYGMFVSMDDGAQWKSFQQNLPVTPITDMKIHRGDLVLSTMGRSFWILDNITSVRQYSAMQNEDGHHLFAPNTTIKYRYPSGARTSNTPKYPRPAVILDYYLSKDSKDPIKLEILDSSGRLVTTFMSDTTAQKQEAAIRDMRTNFVSYVVSNKLETGKGLHRFRWDMSMMGPWSANTSRSYQGGPMVVPGTYEAKLSINGVESKQFIEIQQDPRVEATGITETDLATQLAFQLNIRDLLSEARKLQQTLEERIQKLTKENNKEDLANTQLQKAEAVLKKLKTEEGIYMQPMFIDQLNYLYRMGASADQLMGNDAKDRFEVLRVQFEQLKNELE
ncbi:MAG: hypothetical protein HKN52_09330 [Eudoraea sp.]|nr:hypothetical protein [Eudoraea sp.]